MTFIESYSTGVEINKQPMGSDAWLAAQLYKRLLLWPITKLGQTDLVLVFDQCSSVGSCVQDYKSLRITITIGATWLTHRHTDTQLLTSYTVISAQITIN